MARRMLVNSFSSMFGSSARLLYRKQVFVRKIVTKSHSVQRMLLSRSLCSSSDSDKPEKHLRDSTHKPKKYKLLSEENLDKPEKYFRDDTHKPKKYKLLSGENLDKPEKHLRDDTHKPDKYELLSEENSDTQEKPDLRESTSEQSNYELLPDKEPSLGKLEKLNSNQKRIIDILKLEFEVSYYGKRPEVITDEMWIKLAKCPTRSQRAKLWSEFCKKEKKERLKNNPMIVQDVASTPDYRILENDFAIVSDEVHNSRKSKIGYYSILRTHDIDTNPEEKEFHVANRFILPYSRRHVFDWKDYVMFVNMRFSGPFVIDMRHEKYLEPGNRKSAVQEIQHAYASIRDHAGVGYNMFLCNTQKDSELVKCLDEHTSRLYVNTTAASYLDLFPKENLIYLSPYAKLPIRYIHHDDIFIVSCYQGTQRYCLAEAKKNGIKHARLPIDKSNWIGEKNLSLHILMEIILRYKELGDWEQVLKQFKGGKARYERDQKTYEGWKDDEYKGRNPFRRLFS